MAKKTKEQKNAEKAEFKRISNILNTINDDNYMDYKDEPMFAPDAKTKPQGINSTQAKVWNKYKYLLNPDPAEGKGGGEGTSTVAPAATPVTTSTGKGSVANIANDIMSNAIDNYNNRVANNKAEVATKNEEAAQKRQFDTKKGHTGDRYISLGTIAKEKKLAQRDLREAEAENTQLQKYKASLERYQTLAKQIQQASKNGDFGIDTEAEKQRLQNVNDRITFLQAGHDYLTKPAMGNVKFTDPSEKKKWNELNSQMAELEGQRAVIMDKIKRGENSVELVKNLDGFTKDFIGITGEEIKSFGRWAETDGSQVNRYQFEVANGVYNKINKIMEDGTITPEEADTLRNLGKDIGKVIEEERLKDPRIMDAEDRVNSANAKMGYFLFDNIKSMVILLASLESGSPQRIYTALEQFNKKIADAEAGYTQDEIKALSSNNVKDITGQADAQYNLEQLLPELEKNKAFKNMSKADKAMAVEQLELAFEEYQKYVGSGGKEDFAVWFATQQDNGSGWAAIIKQLISAGALNLDLLKTFGGSSAPAPTAKPKGKTVGFDLGTGGNTQRLAQNILNSVNKEAEKGQQTKKLRDVQATVNNAVASRMGGQGASPQGTANAAPVNTSWGRA